MKFLTKIFVLLSIVTAIGAFYYFTKPQEFEGYKNSAISYLESTPLKNMVNNPESESTETKEINKDEIIGKMQSGVESAQSEIMQISEKTLVLKDHVDNVLGASISPAEDQKQLHERAFEYGRYLYCQEVVKVYEEQN
jgi:hypothetical protein